MITISEALKIISDQTFPLDGETVELADTVGRILAEDIFADMDLPPFDRSQMDGFAVKVSDVENAPAKLKIVGESVAGKGWRDELKSGEALRIMTGAPVPKGADSVQKVELTVESGDFIEILEPTNKNQNIVSRSHEIKANEKVFGKGEIITKNMIAVLASFGYANVKVSKRPKVKILATGSEIVDVSEKPAADQIRNSNSWALKIFAENANADAEILPIAKDDLEDLKKIIRQAAENCDALIISGGVSVGDYDFTKPALRELGAEIFFEKLSLKPGKPLVFAKFKEKHIFGLPGNPVSVAVTFHIFVRTALMLMQNASESSLEKGFAAAAAKLKGAKERDSLLPAFVKTNEQGKLEIESLRFGGSSNFIAFSRANALVFIPENQTYEPGDICEIYFLP